MNNIELKNTAEKIYQKEINLLIENEEHECPLGWSMSPKSVLTYITGGIVNGEKITAKYIGQKRLIEIAIATLLTDRALLLLGEPGTGKSWLSEHLAAAINGDSTKLVQGTAGTTEDSLRYSWNYALLISKGPSEKSLIKSPIYKAMETGTIARVEEISRCTSEVQDALISILSEKRITIPELGTDLEAQKGFALIATANSRDKGVNEMSAALKRRFNIVTLPSPDSVNEEIQIVRTRVQELSKSHNINSKMPDIDTISKICVIFREIRNGISEDKKQKIKQTSGVLSTAEAISILTNSMALASSFGDGVVTNYEIASALQGVVIKNEVTDKKIWLEYLENVMKKKDESWSDLYKECIKVSKGK